MSEVVNNSDEIFDKLERNITDWAAESVELIKDDAIASADEPKTGRFYKQTGKRASAPGESPARISGELVSTFQTRSQVLKASVGTNLRRALYLKDRPVFDLSANKLLPVLEQNLNTKINA